MTGVTEESNGHENIEMSDSVSVVLVETQRLNEKDPST